MATSDDSIDETEFRRLLAVGDDSPPAFANMREPPPSHWGKLTGRARTLSPQYLKFLGKEAHDEQRRTTG